MNATIDPERLARVNGLPLLHGSHPPPNGTAEFCVIEARNYVWGREHGDRLAESEVIGAFLRTWNDSLGDDDRDRLLRPFITMPIRSQGAKAEARRAWMILDWLIREYVPTWLRAAKLDEPADALVALAEVDSLERIDAATPVLLVAKEKSAAARSAAGSAAGAAAGSAAWHAARSAAGSVARAATAWHAAWSAAGYAARYAVGSAAEYAAKSDLQPTVKRLQASAVRLVERMCEV